MDDANRSLEDVRADMCSRCLQPVPPKAARCPQCRQPVHRLRLLPWVAGAAGLLALVFALLVAFHVVGGRPPAPVAEGASQVHALEQAPPVEEDSKPGPPPKPEKRPPLNER